MMRTTIWAVIGWIVLVNCFLLVIANAPPGQSDDPNDPRNRWKTFVDFSGVDVSGDPAEAARKTVDFYNSDLMSRIEKLYEKTSTTECRSLIGEHFGYYLKAFANEKPLPFSDKTFKNTCEEEDEYDFDNLPPGVHMGMIQNRTYQPPRNETKYLEPSEIVLCYGILAHDSPSATIRIIEAVDEPTTQFIVHVDAKYEETHQVLKEYASQRSRVTVLDHPHRVRVNWGGFSMVNATLQMIYHADQIEFTHFVHMAATAYPIASNRRIRNTLADFPADANFMHVVLKPTSPALPIWNYYVECDDRLHRIFELPPLRKQVHGVDIFTSSQWFIISKEYANFLAHPEPGSFLQEYMDYMKHAVVADEHFFGTVLRNTHFCGKHHNWNFLHLQFDQWENERDLNMRDERKCIMPDPNHCGRSPTTMEMDYLDILELSGDLFARKFDDEVDPTIKDVIDRIRAKEEKELIKFNITKPQAPALHNPLALDGHGVLFVAKETISSENPLCMGLGEERNKVRLVPCFYEDVPPTLASNWETGAVILDETVPHNRWEIGPCSSDGDLRKLYSGDVEVIPGQYNPTGPRCNLKVMDGLRVGRCLDGESFDPQPGGPVHVFPCHNRWHQYISFGDGTHAPTGALHTNVPEHTRKRIAETGREQEAYMCLGLEGRGEDEEDWLGKRKEMMEKMLQRELEQMEQDSDDSEDEEGSLVDQKEDGEEDATETDAATEEEGPLDIWHWEYEQLHAIKCSNKEAVIEWVLVPFIEEDDSTTVYEDEDGSADSGDEDGPEEMEWPDPTEDSDVDTKTDKKHENKEEEL
ncbi:unnamed protein product [Cylindrotheca closterium]|uniref:protein xylosyltransferase n=1 Tax=Cylindrotheca closterium TaxID=2856 RepID=A0AAD2JI24_9STRA|nr:unnamed protein product [Cylindrotheca closterium]